MEELPVSAEIEVCGLGYFLLFVNGVRVGDWEFMPAVSNYGSIMGCEPTYPVWEERAKYRCLYVTFDLLPYLTKGENVIGIWLGNGWYHQTRRVDEGKLVFGFPKLRYECLMEFQTGEQIFLESDQDTRWKPSEIIENNLFYGEIHDLRLRQEGWCSPSGEVSGFEKALAAVLPEAELTRQECPPDRELRQLTPVLQKEDGVRKLYDCGENIAGWVSVRCVGKPGEKIRIRHSEELSEDGNSLDYRSAGGERQIQEDCYICNGIPVVTHPRFCWHGFRYFEVEGPGEVVSASLVCSDTPVISSFQCSDSLLNWLYDAFVRTQINNFHNGIPSDCPHRERLGYTGDGQLTSEAAMLLLDTKLLYEKWYQDILDSQGADTGHIPHTAPFLGGGGGPGGWGCAVYVIPMNYYKVYGEKKLLEKGYAATLLWLAYLHTRCENGLVVREEEGGWCLGEWCAPASEAQLPEAFVNTYFYVQGLCAVKEMGRILQMTVPVWVEARLEEAKDAIRNVYFDPHTGDFCEGIGAANAFALHMALGDSRTKENLIQKYKTLGRFDTGIFGTPILIERLFLEGEADLAFALLTNDSPVSFAAMKNQGATTLWEKWDGEESHNHPMFGSVVIQLFTEILGIRQNKASCGYAGYTIAPADIKGLSWAEGSVRTNGGTIRVKWERNLEGRMVIK